MGKIMLLSIMLIVVVVGGVFVYQHYSVQRGTTDGEVHWVTGKPTPEQQARFERVNAGETTDGPNEHKIRTARGEDAAGSPETTGGAVPTVVLATPAAVSAAPPDAGTPTTLANAAAGVPPVTDSLAPNAPNGTRFAGTGTYQWYRQGNLTWRLDTASGRSCIVYATMEEWAKRIVVQHGCGRNG